MIAIIIARGGSKRIPNKNIKIFEGKPMIHYPIEAAIRCGLFENIYISTESQKVIECVRDYSLLNEDVRIIDRPYRLALDHYTTIEIVADALLNTLQNGSPFDEKVCVIYPCSPFLTPKILEESFQVFNEGTMNYLMSIGTSPLRDAGNFYWGKASSFLSLEPIHGSETKMFPIPEGRCIDINTPKEWLEATKMFKEILKKNGSACGPNELTLTPVCSAPAKLHLLYLLLEERTKQQSISHQKLPSYREHIKFVLSRPYRCWWLLMHCETMVGAAYVTHANEIGIFLLKNFQRKGFGTEAIRIIKNVVNMPLLANVNPENKESIAFFKNLGAKVLQVTYKL